jgi:hypothetical protein
VRIKKALASAGVALALVGGVDATTTACGKGVGGYSDAGYVDEVQYGYYDPGYAGDAAHYHYYPHPKQVHIPASQYRKYRYEYQPHGTQHTVTVHRTTTTTTHHSKTGHKITTRHVTSRRTTTTTRRSTTSRHH